MASSPVVPSRRAVPWAKSVAHFAKQEMFLFFVFVLPLVLLVLLLALGADLVAASIVRVLARQEAHWPRLGRGSGYRGRGEDRWHQQQAEKQEDQNPLHRKCLREG